jgi:hypothetical protein
VLSRAREEKADSEKQVGQKNVQSAESEAERWRYEICDSCPKEEKKRSDIALIIGATEVDRGACFAVVGPAGTHKLALAMNLATGWLKKPDQKQHRNLLIVEFGGTGKIPFHCVAWFKERYMPGWNKLESTGTSSRKTVKWWKTHYKPKAGHEASGRSRLGHPSADVLTFQLGELTPEECFHAIDSCIHPNPGDRSEYSAVMLSNTAEMSTGFPALRNDPLFLPSLIDLFQMRGLVSVCIGVEGGGGASQSLDFALLAKADYRISLNHSPDMKFFMRQSGKHPDFSEQKVSLVIDNVLGKDYKRTPRWVSVEPIGKTLHCVADRNWQPAPPEPDPPTGNLPGSQRAQSRRELRSGSRTRRTPSR